VDPAQVGLEVLVVPPEQPGQRALVVQGAPRVLLVRPAQAVLLGQAALEAQVVLVDLAGPAAEVAAVVPTLT
jgi:hypothetical protein